MRVVMVSKALVIGAYQRKLEELACQPGVELTAVVPPYWREGRSLFRLDHAYTSGYELIVAPLALNGQFHLHFYPTLGRLLRQRRPDVLHMDEEPYNLATWHALRLGQAVGVRSLFFTWQNLPRRYPWPFSRFEKINYHRAAHAIAGNPSAADVLRAKGYQGRLAVIPQFGVDPDIFSPSDDADQGPGSLRETGGNASASDTAFVIGYAGRLVPEKGVHILLRACATLSGINWALHLLGKGPEQARLMALAAQLGIAERVKFLGHLSSTKTPEFYRTLDVLAVPSLSTPNWVEQFGRVLIEAMACGVPVVGSNSGEIPWVIGDAGLVFPEGDADALCGDLAMLAADPAQRAELVMRGRARVLAHFTQARVAAATAEVYREMMRGE
jgi:glycosyltransferase involved in cell wall biosynthesis